MPVDVQLSRPGRDEEVAHEQEDHHRQHGDGHEDDECLDNAAHEVGDAVSPVKVAHV